MNNLGNIKLSKKEESLLFDNFAKKLKDKDFSELVSKLDLKDEILFSYTSRLVECSIECKNCKNCIGLHECKNNVKGHRLTPIVVDDNLDFSYVECPYQAQDSKDNAYKKNIYLFEVPKMLTEAYLTDL